MVSTEHSIRFCIRNVVFDNRLRAWAEEDKRQTLAESRLEEEANVSNTKDRLTLPNRAFLGQSFRLLSIISVSDLVAQRVELTSLHLCAFCSTKLIVSIDVFGKPFDPILDCFQD